MLRLLIRNAATNEINEMAKVQKNKQPYSVNIGIAMSGYAGSLTSKAQPAKKIKKIKLDRILKLSRYFQIAANGVP